MTIRTSRLIAILWLAGAVAFSGPPAAGSTTDNAVPTTGSISGSVTDTQGNAAAGLRVSIWPSHHAATTDGSGLFRVSGVSPGLYTVSVSLDGEMLQRESRVRVENGRVSHVNLRITTTPFLRRPIGLAVLVAGGVLAIVVSVAIKRLLSRDKEQDGGAVERPAAG